MSDLRIGVSRDEATAELNAVLASSAFTRSPRLSRLLSYLCTKYLDGEADQIKEYSIGVEVMERPTSFDPANDAGARVEVHRLRRRLQQFYETEGASRKFRILIPVGHYVPAFVPNQAAETPAVVEPAPVENARDRSGEVPFELVADILAREPEAPRPKTPFPRGVLMAVGLVLLASALLVAQMSFSRFKSTPAPPRETTVAAASTTLTRPVVVASVIPGSTVRLACGRSVSYTDRTGQTWSADRYFDGGTTFDSPRQFVARTLDSRLFQSGRQGDFSYNIPLPKGVYELHLNFVEMTYGPGTPSGGGEYSRTFDVKANGRLLLDDFDIYSDANGTNVADTRVFKDISPGSDGLLHLEFRGRRAPAAISTIELIPARPHRLNPIRMVAQESFLTLPNGVVWNPDTYVNSGQLASHVVQVTAENDVDLFSRERYGHFDYAIPVDTGTYSVALYFAEEYFGPSNPGGGGAGSRIFDVLCNGTFLLHNFDVFKEAGMNRGLVKTFHGLTPNAQGKLMLAFVPVRNYASVYAVEVQDESQ